jgi:hypothetical protein
MPGGQAKTALPVWWMYSLRASAARAFCSRTNWAGFFMKAMKNRPPRRVPACGSMPSVKEYPRRRIRVPLCSELASRM